VPAALFMAKAVAQLRLVALSEKSPAAILARWNALLCEHNEAGMFVTLVFIVLDLRTGVVAYSNAGHPPPVLLGAAGARFLPMPRGLVAGMQPDAVYGEREVALAPGETLLLYTDGVTEAEDPKGALYGEERLVEEIAKTHAGDAEALVREVRASVEKHAGGAAQSDDVTLLAIRRR
jgi:sigma-B regulation protein RsbU (phosphoserine phosphatase)